MKTGKITINLTSEVLIKDIEESAKMLKMPIGKYLILLHINNKNKLIQELIKWLK